MKRYKVKSYERTCYACPSQWSIYDDNGVELYARYRHGHFYLEIWDTEEMLVSKYFDDNYGFMSDIDMMENTKDVLDWSNVFMGDKELSYEHD